MEHCLKLVSNHGMPATVIDKKICISQLFLSICNISDPSEHFLQYQRLLRNTVKLTGMQRCLFPCFIYVSIILGMALCILQKPWWPICFNGFVF